MQLSRCAPDHVRPEQDVLPSPQCAPVVPCGAHAPRALPCSLFLRLASSATGGARLRTLITIQWKRTVILRTYVLPYGILLAQTLSRPIDLGRIGGRYFTESAGIGLFADALVLYGTRTGKSLPRLIYAVVRLLLSVHAHRAKLTLDDSVVVERAVMCTVANSPRMGLGAPVAPDALLTDGHLDVVVIGDVSRLDLIRYYLAVMNQTHLELPGVSSAKARSVKIECRRRMQVHCDDRIVGTTPAVITAEAGALRVIVGAT